MATESLRNVEICQKTTSRIHTLKVPFLYVCSEGVQRCGEMRKTFLVSNFS